MEKVALFCLISAGETRAEKSVCSRRLDLLRLALP